MGLVSREVRCTLVAPVPTNRFTGGHLVNEQLSHDPRIRLIHSKSLGETARTIAAGTRNGEKTPVLVDSLFLTDTAGIRALKGSTSAPIGLVAHSLPSLLPGAPVPQRRALLESEKRALELFDFAIAPSGFMRQALHRRGFHPSGTVVITPAPIADGRIAGQQEAGPEHSGDPVRILTIANWSPSKGIDAAWLALQEIADLPWRWQIIGQWNESHFGRKLHAEISTGDLAGRVIMQNPAPPEVLQDAYQAADLFLLPSTMESYGLVFSEAISHGLPVVAVAAAAVPEVLPDCAVLVTAGDARGLVRGLRYMVTDSGERKRLSTLARNRAGALPNWKRVRDQFVAATQSAGLKSGGTN